VTAQTEHLQGEALAHLPEALLALHHQQDENIFKAKHSPISPRHFSPCITSRTRSSPGVPPDEGAVHVVAVHLLVQHLLQDEILAEEHEHEHADGDNRRTQSSQAKVIKATPETYPP
jgi:hypothetical protein